MPFRCYEYTDKQCHNKDELIEFVHTVEPNNIAIYDENNNQHIGIPEDIDKRISDFFDKHGINNLLIEFG